MTAKMTANPFMKNTMEKQTKETVLLRREGRAEEIAITALLLASEDSSYITGEDIIVDGGWTSCAPI
jgi:NAD(P)-dependent dehydrogenase (short-subunit alcohol dehydrogenase family)